MENLENALADLKNGRSRDPDCLKIEIFRKNVTGCDLKNSLLSMFNSQTVHCKKSLLTFDCCVMVTVVKDSYLIKIGVPYISM